MFAMDLLKGLQPYFYCTDAANLERIRATGEIRANIHHRHGEGIFLRSFPMFAKKRSQIIVEDSFGSETVVTETTETQEYAISVYLTDSEVLQLYEQDGSVVYSYREPVIHLPSNTQVITKKGVRKTLNCKVNLSNNLTGYDRVNLEHSQDMLTVCVATIILLTFLVTALKHACGIFSPETSFAVVMLMSVLLCVLIIAGVLLKAKFSFQQKTTMPEIEIQKAM